MCVLYRYNNIPYTLRQPNCKSISKEKIMKKALIIVAHPQIENSVINKRWIEEIKQYPDSYTVHELYKNYPNGKINIEKEQAIVAAHESLILQFPVYWFNCPPLLKQWLDDVLTYGWAYGSKGKQLKDKKIALAVSLGSNEKNYTGSDSLTNVLKPFEMTIRYVNASYQGIFSLYGANTEPDKNTITTEQIEQSSKAYIEFLSGF